MTRVAGGADEGPACDCRCTLAQRGGWSWTDRPVILRMIKTKKELQRLEYQHKGMPLSGALASTGAEGPDDAEVNRTQLEK